MLLVVDMPTVYNNFAGDKELFAACQAHLLAESPPPVLDPDDDVAADGLSDAAAARAMARSARASCR
jgi:hypothetical protein